MRCWGLFIGAVLRSEVLRRPEVELGNSTCDGDLWISSVKQLLKS